MAASGLLGAAAAPLLLRQMRAELLGRGALRATTATAMYALYGAHALAVAEAARRRVLPLPGGLAPAGPPLVLAGAGLVAAGMGRFAGPAQVTGTSAPGLVTEGVYRWSRNPQYVGYLLSLTGVALARRSGAVLVATAATAAVYAWWVPVEEQALRRTYGTPYDDYRRSRPRWLGPRRGA